MAKLRTLVPKIRSKNAGPFWLTIDIFCETDAVYETVRQVLHTAAIARAFEQPEQVIKRFDLPDLRVIKFSLPRPEVQGSIRDRDMHGASWAALVGEIEVHTNA
ncbi:MAG: DUF4387 family protein [Paracoccaceae bacterium]